MSWVCNGATLTDVYMSWVCGVCNGATLTDGYMSWVCGVKLKNRTKTLGIKAVTAVQKCSTLR